MDSVQKSMHDMSEVLETIARVKGKPYANIIMVALNSYSMVAAVTHRCGPSKEHAVEILTNSYGIIMINVAVMCAETLPENHSQEIFDKKMEELEKDLSTVLKQLGFMYESL